MEQTKSNTYFPFKVTIKSCVIHKLTIWENFEEIPHGMETFFHQQKLSYIPLQLETETEYKPFLFKSAVKM